MLLEGITGKATPGKITAILDGSCEGSERILLRVLSGHADMTGKNAEYLLWTKYNKSYIMDAYLIYRYLGEVKGDICINGCTVPQGVRHAGVAFVPVRDAVIDRVIYISFDRCIVYV